MARRLVLAVVVALVPALVSAQDHRDQDHRFQRPSGARPFIPPHGPPQAPFRGGPVVGAPFRGGPVVGPQGHLFSYRGHTVERIRIAPFIYPSGWGYRRWVVGAVLPPLFLVPDYYYADWAPLGLAPPPPGYQWVRYGPDLLLVDLSTGQVADAVYGAFY
jgi:Nickel/cobalt transporter regulator